MQLHVVFWQLCPVTVTLMRYRGGEPLQSWANLADSVRRWVISTAREIVEVFCRVTDDGIISYDARHCRSQIAGRRAVTGARQSPAGGRARVVGRRRRLWLRRRHGRKKMSKAHGRRSVALTSSPPEHCRNTRPRRSHGKNCSTDRCPRPGESKTMWNLMIKLSVKKTSLA